MNRRLPWLALTLAVLFCDVGSAEQSLSSLAPRKTVEAQRSDPQGPQGWGGRFRNWWRRDNPYQKNDQSVKAAYRVATEEAAKATAQVLADDKVVALGSVVDPQGYIVTKASLLNGKITCRIAGHEVLDATLVGASVEHDLALLKVEASDLTPVTWRTEPAAPGTLVAAVSPDGDAIGIGVVSAEPRDVPGPKRQNRRRGWLGVSLGGGDLEVGVTEVIEDSAAAEAGLHAGDEIRSIDGQAMRSMNEIIETVGSHAPGETLVIIVQRQAEQLTKEIVLGKPPQDPEDQWGGGPFSVRREGFPSVLPHDIAVSPSQCGGPLIDMDGNAVGINIARALRVTTYAIPADVVQQFVAQVKK